MSIINTLVLHRIVNNSENILHFEDVNEHTLDKILQRGKDGFFTIDEAFSNQNKNEGICLTFDDGFKSDIDIVFPKLKHYAIHATFFIVKDYIDKDGYMSKKDIIELSNGGMQIGSHSISHPNFLKINDSEIINELISSKKYLEDLTSKEISTFSFPFGFENQSLIDSVFEAGYKYCCTSRHGVVKNTSKVIPRNSINGSQKISTVYKYIKPTFLTRSYWVIEDFLKVKLKLISPKFYTKIRSIVTKN